MYNGIGLNTPRGSGTNGFVQRNLATLRSRPEKVNYKTDADIAKLDRTLQRKPNKEILEHEWKRKIELECVQLQEKLEEQGLGLLEHAYSLQFTVCVRELINPRRVYAARVTVLGSLVCVSVHLSATTRNDAIK